MAKLKPILKNPRILILAAVLLLGLVFINPSFSARGVMILSIDKDSAAALADPPLALAKTGESPRSRALITHVNNEPVDGPAVFYEKIRGFDVNDSIRLRTNKGTTHRLTVQPLLNRTVLNQTRLVNRTFQELDNATNLTVNVTREVEEPVVLEEVIGVAPIGLNVLDAPRTNIRKGLDLSGGTRVILKPERAVTPEEMTVILDNIKQRLNDFGLSDIVVREIRDLNRQSYITVEIAGANQEQVRDLISRQGQFEARIANATVFSGGEDIKNVCLKPECSGIDFARRPCAPAGDGWACGFYFTITLSPAAAQRQADATRGLGVAVEGGQSYLTENLDLYLDGELVDTLRIGAELKGAATTDIQISGSGAGPAEDQAKADALASMAKLQSILETGSLPVKLDIVKSDAISPVLGREFVRNALFLGVTSMAVVIVVLFVRYRKWYLAIPITVTMLSEAGLTVALAALIGWDLDLAAIAGIIVSVGTGVDDQIVITDETLYGETSKAVTLKDRFKRAFFIIMTAYILVIVAMVPLLFAGAGLLKGFAFTSILGVSIGVFITRPAFAAILEALVEREQGA